MASHPDGRSTQHKMKEHRNLTKPRLNFHTSSVFTDSRKRNPFSVIPFFFISRLYSFTLCLKISVMRIFLACKHLLLLICRDDNIAIIINVSERSFQNRYQLIHSIEKRFWNKTIFGTDFLTIIIKIKMFKPVTLRVFTVFIRTLYEMIKRMLLY